MAGAVETEVAFVETNSVLAAKTITRRSGQNARGEAAIYTIR